MEERFFRYLGVKVAATGCILWSGHTNENGYGVIQSGTRPPRPIRASRVSYELFRDKIPDGLHVLHECDTPLCINPVHLFLGTHQNNMADMIAKARQAKGETHGSAKITEADVLEIRRRCEEGETHQSIADLFGISRANIGRIISRESWKHVS